MSVLQRLVRVTGSQDCTEDERQILCYDYTDPPLSVLTSHLLAGFHTMGGDEAMDKFEICMGANLTCMNDLMNRMGKDVSAGCTLYIICVTQASSTTWTTRGSRPSAGLPARTR